MVAMRVVLTVGKTAYELVDSKVAKRVDLWDDQWADSMAVEMVE